MHGICIYCGKKAAGTKDHVPPKSFFPSPRPSNLITVPCCKMCNGKYGKDDERVRNMLISLEATEDHPGIKAQIAGKRNRSFMRIKGKSNFQHIVNSIKAVDLYSSGGIYLRSEKVFNLDQEVITSFMERMTRALIYHENLISYVDCEITWRLAPTEQSLDNMTQAIREFLLNAEPRVIGKNVFSYVGYYHPGRARSLWIMNFYGGIEFMTILREKSNQGTP